MLTKLKSVYYKDYPLKDFTTLKIGGNAELAFFPSNVEEIKEICDFLQENNKPITVIGAGSNLLVSSNGVDGGVIFTSNLKNVEKITETQIKVESGLKSAAFAKFLYENSLAGLEFLIGIPGTIGGAVTMNSSAHGNEIKDVIEEVEIIDISTKEIHRLSKNQLELGYRSSFVENNKHLILNATFNLQKANKSAIKEKMDFHVNYRKEKHPPMNEFNAGSTFRNPQKGVYVGKMLEESGAKEWQFGEAKISLKHANFLLNTGNATSLDISRLMAKMHSKIKEAYNYDLIAEIRYIGNKTEEEEQIWKKFQVH
ncbi:MAG: UDP-N-acetylmuramate dehydrogenase [Candidatus Gastranaerophilales bacterium]|nr:UDP-N-acetylmuramate dehydrogenase [Candidatus Gastranaerophilales bacterium]